MNDKLFPDLMALIDSGMLAQATVRIQARQMLALESMAETLVKIEALLANPPIVATPQSIANPTLYEKVVEEAVELRTFRTCNGARARRGVASAPTRRRHWMINPRGRKRAASRMTERITIPMTPEMLRHVQTAADDLSMPAAEWIRRLIAGDLKAVQQPGEAA